MKQQKQSRGCGWGTVFFLLVVFLGFVLPMISDGEDLLQCCMCGVPFLIPVAIGVGLLYFVRWLLRSNQSTPPPTADWEPFYEEEQEQAERDTRTQPLPRPAVLPAVDEDTDIEEHKVESADEKEEPPPKPKRREIVRWQTDKAVLRRLLCELLALRAAQLQEMDAAPPTEPALDGDIDHMSSHTFAQYVERLMTDQGYTIDTASAAFGIDMIAERDGVRYAVQVEQQWGGSDVSAFTIGQALRGKEYNQCDAAMVVTNRYFQADAAELAEAEGCATIDRDTLLQWKEAH